MEYLDPKFLINSFGLLGIFAIIFAESGLFFGFFLPGDSLLFIAGLFAANGNFNIWVLIFGGIFFAILGDFVGFKWGSKMGPKIFNKEESRFFKKEYLAKTEDYYNKYGPRTIILARFVPIVRTFAPIMAGVGKMEYKEFFFYNCLGGVLWVSSLSLLGYFLGKTVDNIDKYILPIIIFIILASVLPIIFELVKSKFYKK